MLESRWLLLVAAATAALACWLLLYSDRRVYFTAGLSGGLYGIAFLTAPTVERMTEAGSVVEAPVGPVFQVLLAVLAVLSLTVVALRRFGAWPPDEPLPNTD
jgi:ABC-type phosphate transport system permease subunit